MEWDIPFQIHNQPLLMCLKNVPIRLLLFAAFVLNMTACHSLRPVSSNTRTTNRTSNTDKLSNLREDIATYASKQVGAKYKYGAHGPRQFDCSGLTCYIYKEYNIELPSGSYNQARVGKKVPLSQAQAGDLVFFGRGGKVNHVALVSEYTKEGLVVVHSTSSRGVIRENVSKSTYWKPRILYVRNVIGG